jgi:hypothetical protein
MDKGRQIDNVQNVNARMFDKFGVGKTSVRTTNPPGILIIYFRRKIFNLFRLGRTSSTTTKPKPIQEKQQMIS